MSENTITRYLAEHPRLIGLLFAAYVAVAAAGTAAAHGNVISGP